MKLPLVPLAVLFSLVALDAQRGGFGVGRTLVRAADGDRSGDVSAAEWKAFLDSVPEDAKTGVDGKQLLARILLPQLDRDADGEVKSLDLDRLFVARDADRNAVLSTAEIRRRGGIMDTVVLMNADTDGDGEIVAVEWNAFLKAARAESGVSIATAQVWIAKASAASDADRTAFTPGVMLMTLEAGLDPDKDGKITRDDLRRVFAGVDRNNDGVIAKDELAARRAGGRPGGGRRGAMARITAEDRKKPPLMPWQRSLADALALVQKTGKPLLICVNMVGEPASESLAWKRYRDPEFVALVSGFVPILVSPDRQSPIDHGDRGERLPDERFGRLVGSEFIDHEPEIFAKYFKGRRVAPRHVGVAKDGKVLFDIFLTNDLGLIDAALEKHGVPAGTTASKDRTEKALLDSPDAGDRAELEQRFLDGDLATRLRLTANALSGARAVQHPEILRLALYNKSEELLARAVQVVTANVARTPTPLLYRALDLSHGKPVALDALARAVHVWASTEEQEEAKKRAKYLQRIVAALQCSSRSLDARRWREAVTSVRAVIESPPDPSELGALDKRLDGLEKQLREKPGDRGLRLSMAAATLRYARIRIAQGKDPTLLLQDVRSSSSKATSADAPNGLALAHLAVSCHLLQEPDTIDHALGAVQALVETKADAASAIGADALHVFAKERTRALYAAINAGVEWPATWLADVRAAFEVLLDHPAGTALHAGEYATFANALQLWGLEGDVLLRALKRFPESTDLNAKFRTFCLAHRGAEGLERAYLQLMRETGSTPTKLWYTGLATLMAGDRRVHNRMPKAALATYARSIDSFGRSMREDPAFEDTALHYICLGHACTAWVKSRAGDQNGALAAMLSAITARPKSMTSRHGLGATPLQTANELLPRLDPQKAKDLRAALERAGVGQKPSK